MKSQTRPALVAVLKAKMQLHQDIDAKSGQPSVDAAALTAAEVSIGDCPRRGAKPNQDRSDAGTANNLNRFPAKASERMKNLIRQIESTDELTTAQLDSRISLRKPEVQGSPADREDSRAFLEGTLREEEQLRVT